MGPIQIPNFETGTEKPGTGNRKLETFFRCYRKDPHQARKEWIDED
jgi:hypothetical protein